MDTTLRLIRFLLRFGWTVPIFWILGRGAGAPIGGFLLPIVCFLLFGALLTVTFGILPPIHRSARLRTAAIVAGVMVFVLAVIVVTSALTGIRLTPSTIAVNLVILSLEALMVASLRSQELEYGSILSDFRFGILGVVVVLAIVYAAVQRSHAAGPLAFAGVIGYGMFGIASLSAGRRFARDQNSSKDVRTASIDTDWALGLLITLAVMAIVGLLLTQLLAFDIVGTLGTFTGPAWRGSVRLLVFILSEIFRFIDWLASLLGLPKPKLVSPIQPPTGVGSTTPPPKSHHRGTKLPGWIVEALKFAGLAALAIIAILAAAKGIRMLGKRSPQTLTGESRTSSFSWNKMANWLLRRGGEEFRDLLSSAKFNMPHRSRYRTVRDVYRGFLRFGAEEARARTVSETGLEYSADIGHRWSNARPALSRLNTLYMDERYGLRAPSDETVKQALEHLHAVEEAAEPKGP